MRVCSVCRRCYYDDAIFSCSEEGHPPLSNAGDLVPGYVLEQLLDETIAGHLFRARQTASGRSCVIKVISTDDDGRQRFLKEADLASNFFHPNVVDVYETGSLENGDVFVVSEDPDGQSLRELLSNVGTPDLLTSIRIIRQAAEALHALHLRGLVHRAVRPENVVLGFDRNNKLLVRVRGVDIGGVGEHATVSNKLMIDSAIDAIRYFAPEQFDADGSTTPKSDLYGLGVVFYEMLAGRPPFDAEKAAGLIEKHRHEHPPDVRIDNFDLRMLVTHALFESLGKQAWARQSSAGLFARQLRHIEQLATHIPTPPAVVAVKPPRPKRQIAKTSIKPVAAIADRPAPSIVAAPVVVPPPVAPVPVPVPEAPTSTAPTHAPITAKAAPKKVALVLPENDIPSKADVNEVLVQEGRPEPVASPLVLQQDEAGKKIAADQARIVDLGTVDAGHARSNEVETGRSGERRLPISDARETGFVPNFMGLAGDSGTRISPRAAEPMFAAYPEPASPPAARNDRLLTVGGLLIVLVGAVFGAAYLLDDDSETAAATETTQAVAARDPQQPSAAPAQQQPIAPTAETIDPIEQDEPPALPPTDLLTTARADAPSSKGSEPAVSKPRNAVTRPSSGPQSTASAALPLRPIVVAPGPISSTRVITYDKEKARASVAGVRDSTGRRPIPPQPDRARSVGDGSTRARIVANPRP